MRLLRLLSLIGLVLTLVSGSVTMASARHQARAVGEVVICNGYGVISISVDDQGNPTGPVILCPDCVPALAALTDVALHLPAAPATLLPHRFLPRDLPAPARAPSLQHRSRAPPVAV